MGLLADMAVSSAERVRAARRVIGDAQLQALAVSTPSAPPLSLGPERFDVIAELKLRSPSLGDLSARTPDPMARLRGYAEGGAAVCSILTEPARFDGDLSHLRRAADALAPFGVPALRKDFLIDPYQVLEARVHGASGVLLIVRMLERERLVEMLDAAASHALFVLLEAFDADDLAVARAIAGERAGREEQVLMGLNCRDLQTLQIDFGRLADLRDQLPPQWPSVAESGVASPADAARVARLGYRLALVGTTLMQRDDPARAVRDLLQAGREAVR